MKNTIKIVATALVSLVILSSCGKEVEKSPISDFSSTTALTTVNADNQNDTEEIVTTTMSLVQKVDKAKDAVTKTSSLPDQIIPETTTTTTTVTYKEYDVPDYIKPDDKEIVDDDSNKDYYRYMYKPDTHYVHRATCHWVDDTCYEITSTEGLEVRLCSECNPDITVEKEYKEKKKTTTTQPAMAPGDTYADAWPEDQRLSPYNGTIEGPSGKETYYNLDMSGVISIMRDMGFDEENYPYWIRDDKAKMLGNYVMCAANLEIHPRGTLVRSSLGMCLVCDTGTFAYSNPYQIDLACDW